LSDLPLLLSASTNALLSEKRDIDSAFKRWYTSGWVNIILERHDPCVDTPAPIAGGIHTLFISQPQSQCRVCRCDSRLFPVAATAPLPS